MLDAKYFKELGQPSARRLESLPVYLLLWMNELKRQAIFWHARSEGRRVDFVGRLPTYQPSAERLATLPVWAQEWINTLRFEVTWWRDQAKSKSARPVSRSLF